MAHCSGCGVPLSWKKYRFQRMWKIPGYFCKKCMLDLGKDFDKYGRIVTPARPCDLCNVEFYFLKAVTKEHKRQHYCHVCHESVVSGSIPESAPGFGPRPQPRKLPQVMMIFAGLGVLMMVMGLIFTMTSTGENANVANIMFGAVTTALGFVLFRKTIRSRSMLLDRNAGLQAR